ncbi:radical SAM protein [bacterium]|nr:MAG: radical SAM protein [bacterium]
MRLVFLDPPSPPGRVAFRDAHGGYGEMCRASRLRTPTLDVFHAAAWAREAGAATEVVDAVVRALRPEEAVAAVRALRPDVLAVRTAFGSLPHDLRTGLRAKAASGAKLVFFGPQAAVDRERLLAAGADAVVLGEAPEVFAAVARRGLTPMTGLALPGAPPPPPAFLEDVDRLPVPRWDRVDWRRYSYVTAQTSWGCPVGCGYCPYPLTQGRAQRFRSAASVVAEFSALRRMGVPFVLLRDPFFTLARRRVLELCAALERAGTPLLWGCETRLEAVDDALAAALARAGCIRVQFALESADPGLLKAVGRSPLPAAKARAQVALLKRHGMLTYAFYMFGLPGETEASARATLELALTLGTDAAAFSAATPFPGTALAGRPERGGLGRAAAERLREEAKERWKQRPRAARKPSPLLAAL